MTHNENSDSPQTKQSAYDAEGLSLLGASKTEYPTHPDDARLETIPAGDFTKGGRQSFVTLDCPEFTSLCPKTSQPDFATIRIKYQPNERLVESKALKMYLFSYRNVGMFHEAVVQKIADDLWSAMEPQWIEVVGDFMPRGGISIIPIVTRGELAE